MSEKDLLRVDLVQRNLRGEASSRDTAGKLGISKRHLRRLRRRVIEEGVIGLAHKGRGQPSGRAMAQKKATLILELMRNRYVEFGPTLTSEMLLKEYGLLVSREKIRQMQIANGLLKPKRRRALKYHPRRTRRSRFGELVQIDGSHHDWLEGRCEKFCLIAFVDDATSQISHGKFVDAETTENYMRETITYIERYGRPMALYSDKHGIFRINTHHARDKGALTQFGRCMKDVNIELICAETPQAKGRVERSFQTLQDRLVKEMRLANVCTMAEANMFLEGFLESYNKKFGILPANNENAHKPLETNMNLETVFSIQEIRTLSKNLDFQYKNCLYQIVGANFPNRLHRQKVIVSKTLSGKMIVKTKNGVPLKAERYHEFSTPAQRTLDVKDLLTLWPEHKPYKPGRKHPWR